jgi:FkbM family methyltransferase
MKLPRKLKRHLSHIGAAINALRGEARIDGIRLPIDHSIMSPDILRMLGYWSYEAEEMRMTSRAISPGDAVLELGAGLGFLSSYLRRFTPAGSIVCIEANPGLIPYIKRVHAVNRVRDITVINGVVQTEKSGNTVPFYCRRDFPTSSLNRDDEPFERVVDVELLALPELLKTYRPRVLAMDIEGSELELLTNADNLDPVRSIVLELHPAIYGSRGVARIVAAAKRLGFSEEADGPVTKVRKFTKQQ